MQDKFIGDYRVIEPLAPGTLGATYLVEHRFTKRRYMLKALPKVLSQDHGFLSRFEDQIERIASLDHPNLVKIHTISSVEGAYFLVTDYIEGAIPLTQLKEEWEEETILAILTQIASALDYAHSYDLQEPLFHGALKLNNILVQRDHKEIKVFLSDFGLMTIIGYPSVIGHTFKAIAEEFSYAIQGSLGISKQRQSFLQTYAFLAPEQKNMQEPTYKSDFYAFGVVVYYLTMGLFPEGFFPMPSEGKRKYNFDFDSLIKSTLGVEPAKRATRIFPLLIPKEVILVKETTPPIVSIPSEPEKPAAFESVKKSIESGSFPSKMGGVATVTVTAKPVTESTATILNPPKDESYAQALKSMLHREPVVTHYQPEKRYVDNLEPIHTEVAVIPAGHSLRGSQSGARDEMPRHQIYLKSFAIDVHPVTNEQFVRFLEYMGGEKDEQYNDLIRLKESRLQRVAGHLSIESGYTKHPVVGVTWYGAVAYARWVNKRLPTEAEWEVAAAGGLEEVLYPTGMVIEKNQANFFSSDTTPVKNYAPNPFGLYDMAGNVYEWCQDWYGYNYYEVSQQEPNQPAGPPQGVYRVLRGGCWKSLKDDLRIAHRHRNNPGTVTGTYGFRCAADV